jgi:hypothetical protein
MQNSWSGILLISIYNFDPPNYQLFKQITVLRQFQSRKDFEVEILPARGVLNCSLPGVSGQKLFSTFKFKTKTSVR